MLGLKGAVSLVPNQLGGTFDPVFSPDGTKLAFFSNAELVIPDAGPITNVFVKDLNTGSIKARYRGIAYGNKGEYDRAIADYDQTLRLKPDYATAYNNRAWAYFKAGKAAQGLPDAERSLELRPNDAHALDTRAHIFEALGRREEARHPWRGTARAINCMLVGSNLCCFS